MSENIAFLPSSSPSFSAEVSERVPLGIRSIDECLGGGLAFAALHEILPQTPFDLAAASGFVLGLSVKARRLRVGDRPKAASALIWIVEDFALQEGGFPYGPGFEFFGLAAENILCVRAASAKDALWAMEESLRLSTSTAVILELASGHSLSLNASRRLVLAAQAGTSLGFILRHSEDHAANAVHTRWKIKAQPSTPDHFGGLGPTDLLLTLTKNRRGPLGAWSVHWNRHDKNFDTAADSLPLVHQSAGRPIHTAGLHYAS